MPYPIQDYSEKPSFNPLGKSPWGIYLGVELEVEVNNPHIQIDCANSTRNALGNFIITKHDGSLQNGFEICSSPASLEHHKKAWNNFFYKQKIQGLQVSSRCGMHVHISKSPLSTLQVGKILVFLHSARNREFVSMIAQRNSGTYNNFTEPRKHSHALKAGQIERRSAVNLQNANTVEIRIFRSTLNGSDFFKNLEFCEALVAFTFPSVISVRDGSDYKTFVKYVYSNSNLYPNLCKFLAKNGYKEFAKKERKLLPSYNTKDILLELNKSNYNEIKKFTKLENMNFNF